MLVLSRKKSESIEISGGIRIVLIESRRGKARLGIEAPPEVKVVRSELLIRDIRKKSDEKDKEAA